MARPKMKVCSVSGIKTSENNFYKNQNHVKAVDNLRLLDIKFPAEIRDSFKGPQFGIKGIRKIFKAKEDLLLHLYLNQRLV